MTLKKYIKRGAALLLSVVISLGVFVAYLFVTPIYEFKRARLYAQTVFELSCPLGTTSVQALQTFDQSTGKYRQNYCVDVNGNVTESNGTLLNIVDAASFGVKADTFYVTDATITNGTSVVSLPNAEYIFTSADLGKVIFCTNETTDTSALNSVIRLAQTTILSILSPSSVNVNANATASLVGVATCAWGHDDSSALIAAWNAAGAKCGTLLLPVGWMMLGQVNFNTSAAYCGLANRSVQLANGVAVTGWGPGSTFLIILPGLDPTTCTFGGAGIGCFFGAPAMQISNFSIFGLGNSTPGAGFNSKVMLALDNNPGTANPMMLNIGLYGWGAAQGSAGVGVTGVNINGSNPRAVNVFSDAFGYNALKVTAADMFMSTASTFAVNAGTSLVCSGGKMSSSLGVWTWTTDASTRAINIQAGCIADFFGDEMNFVTAAGQTVLGVTGAGSVARLHGVYLAQGSATGFGVAAQTGGQIHADGSSILSVGTGIFTDGTGQFFDDCGNTITGTITVGSNAAIVGNCSVDTTALAVGNVVPSANWGTAAAISAPFGQTRDVSFTLTNGNAAVGANPTLVYTFPKQFLVRPNYCIVQQTGGTQAQIVNEWTVGVPSATSVTITYNATPTINLTEIIAISCH